MTKKNNLLTININGDTVVKYKINISKEGYINISINKKKYTILLV